ncbi:MAG: ABC transporter ATP-binding protein [Phycisphaerae bacterium]|jgi:putative ABC transport system ATP-binding protein|nr:ABC transporter ATP-binding protein [Phycisphaerae bacterium]
MSNNGNIVTMRGIERVYYKPDGSVLVNALRGVDLDVPSGQSLAIMGPSGSGKSTLMNILGCLDQPTNGSFTIAGNDVSTLDDASLSLVRGDQIGFVFQSFNLIPQLTIEENVEVPLFYRRIKAAQRKIEATAILDRVGLGDRIGHKPSELSGGQQQRAAIARALVTNPSILLADEPTGNLDSKTGNDILKLFDEMNEEGLTIIVVTHDDVVGKRCDRTIHLCDGLIDKDTQNG